LTPTGRVAVDRPQVGGVELEPKVEAAQWGILEAASGTVKGDGTVKLVGGILEDLAEVEACHSQALKILQIVDKIRLIEGNAKCRHLKKLICKGTLRQVFICLRPTPR
jgi:hypothetical protein